MRHSRWVSHAAARRLASSGMRGTRVDWEGRERRLMQRKTSSPTLQSTEFSTQHEQGPGIPGSLLDIIVKRIWVALLEIPQGCCASCHFPNPKDYHPDDVEEQSKQ